MSNPDILFKGVPRGPTRGYTADVLRTVQPLRVVIPCTGSFSLAWVAREAGVTPDKILCGDISLYSTALGQAIMGQDWRLVLKADVKAEYADLLAPLLTDPLHKAAAVLLMIRILQHVRPKPTAYHEQRRRELVQNAPVYLEQLTEQIQGLTDALHGLSYVAQDMWVTMAENLDDGQTVNLINPPRYSGGYGRMFAGIEQIFDWDEPRVGQFVEKDYARLMDFLKEKPALSLMYYATDGADPSPLWGEPWRAVFADRPGSVGKHAAINWIIANRTPTAVEANRAKIHSGKAKFKLFDGVVHEKADLRATRVDKVTGDYYRDLFIHRLPGSVTEVYVALLLDGYLFGIVGLHLADLRRGKVIKKGEKVLDHCASVTFAFTGEHSTYDRLHKLTLMAICSTWFWADVLGSENWYEINGAPKHIKTTMLTQHPEVKSARGIMKLDTREAQPDGTYKLTYSTTVTDRERQATLQEWLTKFGGKVKA